MARADGDLAMTRSIPQADSAAAVNPDHLLMVLDPDSDDPIAQTIRDVVLAVAGGALSYAVFPIAAGTVVADDAAAAPQDLSFGAALRTQGTGIDRAAGNASLTLDAGTYEIFVKMALDRTDSGTQEIGDSRANLRILIETAAGDTIDDQTAIGYLRGFSEPDIEGTLSYHIFTLAARTTVTIGAQEAEEGLNSPQFTTVVGGRVSVSRKATASTVAAGGASLSDATPEAPGVADAGSAADASRSDHVHPLASGGQLQGVLDAHFGNTNWRQSIQGGLTAVSVATAGAWATLRDGANPPNLGLASASYARGVAALYLTDGTQPAQIRAGDLFVYDSTNDRWERAVRLPDIMTALADYALLAGAVFTGAVSGIAPTEDAHFTRKDYVDRLVAGTHQVPHNELLGGISADAVPVAGELTVAGVAGARITIPAYAGEQHHLLAREADEADLTSAVRSDDSTAANLLAGFTKYGAVVDVGGTDYSVWVSNQALSAPLDGGGNPLPVTWTVA